jgi:hypothetical protein
MGGCWTQDRRTAVRARATGAWAWREQFFELLWVTDAAEARANPLRLERRADWTSTGASPIGLGFRGQIEPSHSDEFWLYDALGPRIWIHRDNERFPEQRELRAVSQRRFDHSLLARHRACRIPCERSLGCQGRRALAAGPERTRR